MLVWGFHLGMLGVNNKYKPLCSSSSPVDGILVGIYEMILSSWKGILMSASGKNIEWLAHHKRGIKFSSIFLKYNAL